MRDFIDKVKKLRFEDIFNKNAINRSLICQNPQWFSYFLIMTWVMLAFKYYVRYNLRMGYIRIQFGEWVAIHFLKDIHILMFILYLLNFIFCIIWYHVEQTRENWFDFNASIKSNNEIPEEVKKTWIYKYIYIYISNFNIFLLFFCFMESDHIFRVIFLPLGDALFVLSLCLTIHIIFWINYFFNYSKRKQSNKNE